MKKICNVWHYEQSDGTTVSFTDLQCIQINIWNNGYQMKPSSDSEKRYLKLYDNALDFYKMEVKIGQDIYKIIKMESHLRKRAEAQSRCCEPEARLILRPNRNFDIDSL